MTEEGFERHSELGKRREGEERGSKREEDERGGGGGEMERGGGVGNKREGERKKESKRDRGGHLMYVELNLTINLALSKL